MNPAFRNVSGWVFDLDNTLYPAACDLFAQIDVRMTTFVSEYLGLPPDEARKIQKQYYAEYGTTLNGLMHEHGMTADAFLHDVHDIDLSVLPELPGLKQVLERLPGPKYVFTNGSRGHAESVTDKLGIGDSFDGMFGIEDAAYEPKPNTQSFERFHTRFDLDPNSAVMFEDMPRNLATAHAMGYRTVLVTSDKDWSHEPESVRPASALDNAPYIHHSTDDLTGFLESVLRQTPESNDT